MQVNNDSLINMYNGYRFQNDKIPSDLGDDDSQASNDTSDNNESAILSLGSPSISVSTYNAKGQIAQISGSSVSYLSASAKVVTPTNQGITISDIETKGKVLKYDIQTKNSDAVKKVQDRLKALGYAIGKDAYGTYDKGTEAAVNQFQKDNPSKLIVGDLGSNTWKYLRDTNADDYKNFGKKVTGISGLKGLSAIDVLARTIYGENNSTAKDAQEAVAWTIINRKNSGGKSYTDIVFAKSQYTGLTGEDGNGSSLAKNPDKLSQEWQNALAIAKKMVNNQTSQISNPIGKAEYFRSSSWFDKNTLTLKNGQVQLKNLEGKYDNIKNIIKVQGNTFFSYGTK